ncbi:hypothetical protein GCM10010206_61560 [Streptomyces cinerochromogenes]|nr:hypothetical protein GCM10010206_61560 [Streptomyces cinerochromogenes]
MHAIATHSGFRRAADFTRVFRRAYGVSPRGYRHEAAPWAVSGLAASNWRLFADDAAVALSPFW